MNTMFRYLIYKFKMGKVDDYLYTLLGTQHDTKICRRGGDIGLIKRVWNERQEAKFLVF